MQPPYIFLRHIPEGFPLFLSTRITSSSLSDSMKFCFFRFLDAITFSTTSFFSTFFLAAPEKNDRMSYKMYEYINNHLNMTKTNVRLSYKSEHIAVEASKHQYIMHSNANMVYSRDSFCCVCVYARSTS